MKNPFYFVLIALMYLFLVIFTVLRLSKTDRKIYYAFLDRINAFIHKNKKVFVVFDFIKYRLLFYFGKALAIIFKFLKIFSYYIYKLDLLLKRNDFVIIGEPVNYAALVLRKLYTENVQAAIVYISLVIVLFYFILSVF
jgi:hypothetical protein